MKECRDGPRKYAATTLWTVFSCLNKFCLHLYEINLNVSINDSLIFIFFLNLLRLITIALSTNIYKTFICFQSFVAVTDFLHLTAKKHEKKKAWVLTADQTKTFMTEASNENCYWLVRKVAVAINLYGGLRGAVAFALVLLIDPKVREVRGRLEMTSSRAY